MFELVLLMVCSVNVVFRMVNVIVWVNWVFGDSCVVIVVIVVKIILEVVSVMLNVIDLVGVILVVSRFNVLIVLVVIDVLNDSSSVLVRLV